jgi:phospholysine phosphohistidine inorganic pyrophosphate phosphatase
MPRAILFDLDGTIYEHGIALPGAPEAVAALQRRGIQVGFVTNTTSRSRRLLSERLTHMGMEAPLERIATALLAGAEHLKAEGFTRIAPLVPEKALEDLSGFEITAVRPQAVIVGDLDDQWSYQILNTAFRQLMDGAELIAFSVDRYWQDADGLVLDCGPFVKALEYASGREAVVCGKPAAEFYRTALASLGPWALEHPEEVLMVGDDLWGDIQGAQDAGLKACLVRTGKFREDVFAKSGVHPDHLIESVGEIASVL